MSQDNSVFTDSEIEKKYIFQVFANKIGNAVIEVGGLLSKLSFDSEGSLTKAKLRYLKSVRNELNQLEKLITQVIEFSRFEAEECKPFREPLDIKLAITKTIEIVKLEAKKKNIKIIFENVENTTPIIYADTVMINRGVINLLVNAIKFTDPEGTITVKLFDREKDILIQVQDTGRGISEDRIPYIFDAFYFINADSKGSGFGLSIVKVIVEAHGGEIWAESVLGIGSTFNFTLQKEIVCGNAG